MKKLFVKIMLVASLACVLSAQNYTITTVAGSSTAGVGDGGFATLAPLVTPVSAVADGLGNVYIADPGVVVISANCGNNQCVTTGTGLQTLATTIGIGRIRKIDGVTGQISTLTTAVTEPRGLALSADGLFLYVADTAGNRIRKVDTTTGANTTVACTGTAGYSGDGHEATLARCRGPRAVVVAPNGDFYFADSLNNRVRKVTKVLVLVNGVLTPQNIITTVAGRGPSNSTVTIPTGTAALAVNPADGSRTQGDGGKAVIATLANPEGLALDSSGNLYISDTGFNRIRKVDTTGIISTVAGLGTAGSTDGVGLGLSQFNSPRGLTFDSAGNLYVADSGNNRVRQISFTNGVVRTVAGGGTAGDDKQAASSTLNGPTSVAFDSTGAMIISDQNNGKVRRVDGPSGIIGTLAGVTSGRGDNGPALNASLSSPRGVAVGSDGSVYISDSGNHKIRKVTPPSNIISVVAGTGVAGNGLSASLGGANGPGVATFAALNSPGCVAVDSSNNVYIADRVNGKIRKVDATGIFTTVVNSGNIVPAAGTALPQYQGDGGSPLANNVLNTGTGIPGAGSTNLNGPNCVAVDNLGNIYIADTSNNVIRQVSNGIITTIVGFQTVNGCPPASIAPGCVPIVPASGVPSISGVAGIEGDGGTPANQALLSAPQGIGIDATGTQLCIADTQNHLVRQVDINKNTITTIAGIQNDGGADTLAATTIGWTTRLNLPAGCAFDSIGNVFIADTSNNRILRVDKTTGILTAVAGANATGTAGTDFNSDGKAGGTARLFQPVGITVDTAGNVFFTDRFGLIKKLTPAAATTP